MLKLLFLFQLIGFNHERLLYGNSICTPNEQQQSSKSVKTDSPPRKIEKTSEKEIDLTKSPIQVKIVYEWNNNKQNTLINAHNLNTDASYSTCDINSTTNDSLTKGQTLLTSYFRPIEQKSTYTIVEVPVVNEHDDWNDSDNALHIDYAPTNVLTIGSGKTDKKCLLLQHRKRIRRKYKRISTLRQRSIDLLLLLQRRYPISWPQLHIILFQRVTCEFLKQSEQNETILNKDKLKMTTESIAINRRVQKETNEFNNGDGAAKRPPKNQRSSDNSRLLLLSENVHESSEKDFGMYFA